MEMESPLEKITFLHKIDTNSGFGRDWDTLWTKSSNDIFITLQMKAFGPLKYRVSHIEECKVNQLWGVEESIISLIYGA